jgi:hypothetical protein
VILKIVPKAAMSAHCTLEENRYEIQGKPKQNFDATFGTIFGISKFFKKRKTETSYFFFSLKQGRLKI